MADGVTIVKHHATRIHPWNDVQTLITLGRRVRDLVQSVACVCAPANTNGVHTSRGTPL